MAAINKNFTGSQTTSGVTTDVWNSEVDSSINNQILTIPTKDKYLDRDIKITLKGSSSGTAAVIASEGSVTTNPTVKTTISAPTTGYGFTTTKPSGTVGTNYVALTSSTNGVSTNGTVQTKYKVTTAGYTPTKDATNSGTVSVTGVTNGTGVSYYQPIVTATVSGGGLSGGGLTKGSGSVETVQQGVVTPSVGGTGVNSTAQSSYGVTTTKPSGTDGTNYVTFDPGASVTTNNTVRGKGSVTRDAVTRAAVTLTNSAGAIAANNAVSKIDADNTTIKEASLDSNWSSTTNSNPSIAAGTNYYVPVSAASTTGGTASASATIEKDPSASASVSSTGISTSTTATNYYVTASASSASGYSKATASATGGSASVTKGITAGASANGAASGNKSATSTEKTASDSKTVYIKEATTGTSNSGTNVSTISPSTSTQYVNITEGYTPAKKWTINAVSASTAQSIVGNASFANTATSGTTYTDYTSSGPVLKSGDYLYINAGYTPARKISLAKLVPDGVTLGTGATSIADGMLNTFAAYDNDGALITGNIATKTDSGNASLSSSTLSKSYGAGYYPNAHGASISASSTGTSNSGTKVSTISPTTSTQYVNITAGATAAKYWEISGVSEATAKSKLGNATISANSPTITPSIASTVTNGTTNYAITGSATTSVSVGTAGYISSSDGTKNTGTASISGSVAQSQVSTSGVTVPSGTTPTNIAKNTNIKISAGYYPTDRYYKTQDYSASSFASGNIELTQSTSTSVVGKSTATVKTGSATTPATTITANPSIGSYDSTNKNYPITVSKTQSVTPSVTAGWVASGTAGTITVSGSATVAQSVFSKGATIPSGSSSIETLAHNQVIKIAAGYYPSDRYYTIQSYNANSFTSGTYTASGAVTSADIGTYRYLTIGGAASAKDTASATITGGSGNETTPTTMSILTTAPTSGNYYTITANGSGNSKITTAGWIGTGSLASASTTKDYYIKKGVITNNTSGGTSSGTINRGSQIKISAGYYPSDLYYQAQGDAHSTFTPSSLYFTSDKSDTSIIVSTSAVIQANKYNSSDWYLKKGTIGGITGGSLSKTATLDWSTTDVGSGVSITRNAISCSVTTGGWISAVTKSLDESKYYLKGVTVSKPSTGENKFYIKVPNGNSDAIFYFHVKSDGNVYVTDGDAAV